MFWRRWVETTARSGLGKGSIAYAIETDPTLKANVYIYSDSGCDGVAGAGVDFIADFIVADFARGA